MKIDVLAQMEGQDYEQVVFCQSRDVGLKAIIAIHNTVLGPALGGTRMWPYASEDDALTDALRLAKGMTFKAAAAGLKLGGGKAVILGDPKCHKTKGLFEAYGHFVDSLSGLYITTEDVGTSVDDMESVRSQTSHVVGTSRTHGGSGDPSPYTAAGIFLGMKECVAHVFGNDSFKGRHVALQGVGSVGRHLVRRLVEAGAKVTVADIDAERLRNLKQECDVDIVSHDDIFAVECDIFSPCALGGVINDRTLPAFRCRIIAGSANNQLERSEHAEALTARGILYAPDYVINAGGLINVSLELTEYDEARCLEMLKIIPRNISQIVDTSIKNKISTSRAADSLVEECLKCGGHAAGMYSARKAKRKSLP